MISRFWRWLFGAPRNTLAVWTVPSLNGYKDEPRTVQLRVRVHLAGGVAEAELDTLVLNEGDTIAVELRKAAT